MNLFNYTHKDIMNRRDKLDIGLIEAKNSIEKEQLLLKLETLELNTIGDFTFRLIVVRILIYLINKLL